MASTSLNAAPSEFRKAGRFPKSKRLSRKRLIQPLFDRDNPDTGTISSGCIRLLHRLVPVEEVGHRVPIQVGFAVGRSSGGAVVRNRVKRVLRDTYRRNQDLIRLPRGAGSDTVLTVMVVVRRLPQNEQILRDDLLRAMASLTKVQNEVRTDSTPT